MKSTAKISLSLGKRSTTELLEWLRPTQCSSATVPPNSMVARSEKVICGAGVGRFSPTIGSLAFSCATKIASVQTSPPEI